ncbi:MAG: hypothetical protein ACI9FD_002292, partial [Gammaproteobacteria bacterium]
MQNLRKLDQTISFLLLVIILIIAGVIQLAGASETSKLPPPIVTHKDGSTDQGHVAHGEIISGVDETRKALHAQHHPHGVLETRRIPGNFTPAAMTAISDFALPKDKLIVINPGPGEFV